MKFNPGERIEFESKVHGIVRGTVVKLYDEKEEIYLVDIDGMLDHNGDKKPLLVDTKLGNARKVAWKTLC